MRTLVNPYRDGVSTWLKGNLHAHTTRSDGNREPQAVIDAYAAARYDFLMISDHDALTDPNAVDPRGMILIPGNEVTALGPHILHVNARTRVEPDGDRQRVIDAIQADAGFAIVNHPTWEKHYNHCPQEKLETWTGYTGIEIYNGVVRRLEGTPLATDRWDRLLSAGRRVWGFANDDSHVSEDDCIAWNVVQSDSPDCESIVQCLRDGRFYASTGVVVTRIEVEDLTVRVNTSNAQRIIVFSDFGHRLAAVDEDSLVFELPAEASASYIRIECYGPGESMAWTQPFWIACD